MNLQKQAKIDKARKLYEKYCENIESAGGTIEHGVVWSAKTCFDKDSKDYTDETDKVEDNKVACALIEQALEQISDACVILRYTSCPERLKYFKTAINCAVKLKAYALAYKMAVIGSEKKAGFVYFMQIMKKYRGRKDEDKNSVGTLDLQDFEINY